jgi:hypothetical protein
MNGAKLLLEIVPECAGADIDKRCRSVSLLHAFETAAIETDAAEDRDGAAADAASPTSGGDGDAGFIAAPEHGSDFGSAGRPSDDTGPGGHGSRERPSDGDGPPVSARLGERLRSHVDDGARAGEAF